jgi:hypothetical protein
MSGEGEECVICYASIQPEDSGLCDAHKYDEQIEARERAQRSAPPTTEEERR